MSGLCVAVEGKRERGEREPKIIPRPPSLSKSAKSSFWKRLHGHLLVPRAKAHADNVPSNVPTSTCMCVCCGHAECVARPRKCAKPDRPTLSLSHAESTRHTGMDVVNVGPCPSPVGPPTPRAATHSSLHHSPGLGKRLSASFGLPWAPCHLSSFVPVAAAERRSNPNLITPNPPNPPTLPTPQQHHGGPHKKTRVVPPPPPPPGPDHCHGVFVATTHPNQPHASPPAYP